VLLLAVEDLLHALAPEGDGATGLLLELLAAFGDCEERLEF
jgi:hypothetical protein